MVELFADKVIVTLEGGGMTNTVQRGKVFDIVDHVLGMHAWFTDSIERGGRVVWTLTPMTPSATAALHEAVLA